MKEVKTLVLGKKKAFTGRKIPFAMALLPSSKEIFPQPFRQRGERKRVLRATVSLFHLFYQVGEDKRLHLLHSILH